MSPLSKARLEAAVASSPGPIVSIDEDERWLRVGAVRLNKSSARLDVGFTHPINDGTRFELQPFELGDRRGAALVLIGAGPLPDYFVGWVPSTSGKDAKTWVARLNTEIEARLTQSRREIDEGRTAQTLIFHLGSEYAPDSPWGGERLELSTAGGLEYERRRAGTNLRTVHAEVDPSRAQRLLALLSDTSFPEPLQALFPPGASVCTLITDPPHRQMLIDPDSAEHTKYEEILGSLTNLARALRESDAAELRRWSFRAAER